MRTATGRRLAIQLFIIFSIVASLLAVSTSTSEASANVFDCPGVHNVDISVERIPETLFVTVDLDWETPLSYYRAALFCPRVFGFVTNDADNNPVARIEWTALEFLMWRESNPAMTIKLSTLTNTADRGCEWTATIYSRPDDPETLDSVVYSKSVDYDYWGTPYCKQVTDALRPIPRLSLARVVSENPPSIEP